MWQNMYVSFVIDHIQLIAGLLGIASGILLPTIEVIKL